MAQLKDLLVTGASRLIGDIFTNKIQVTKIDAPTASNGTTYGPGSSGQVLMSNGTSTYWGGLTTGVGGVKGNAESSYRTGNVNLTPANIGAVNKAGDTMTGNLTANGTATLGTAANPWHQLVLGGATSATMTADSTNPKITFGESNNGSQPVHIIYSDYDSYRAPAGLKIIGGASANPAWLEVEGDIYGAAFKGNADTATTATKATQDGSGNTITSTYLKLSGGTMTGALNTPNNTWNVIGDDVQLGDINRAGSLGIQGKNGNTGLFFTNYNQTNKLSGGAIDWDGSKFTITGTVATSISGNATSATVATKLGTTTSNTTSAGSASVPVYFNEGVPVPVSLDDLRTDMGITNPITFWGVTTTTLTNGSTTTSLAGLSGSPQNGYVVIDNNGAQFIWGTVNNVAQWNQLGTGVAYKIIQSAVSSPTANGSTTAFIDTISQNANGVITVTKKSLDTSGAWSGSAAKLTTARSLKTKLDSTTAVTFDGSAAQDAIPVTGTLPIGHGGTGATTAKAARENLGAAPTPFVAGTQTASTNVWTGALPSNVTEYYNGLTIDYFLPYAGTSSAATLNLGGLGAKPVYVGNAATTAVTTHFPANSVLHLTYIVNSALNSGNGCWKVTAYQNSTYYYESCYVTTGASTAAKAGTLSNYALQPGYLQVAIYNANTAASALTLNINGTGAKPIYINGTASSSSNYTLPKGMYFVYYNGTNFYFRTDGMIQGKIQSAVQDGSGNNIASTYQTKHKTATITIAVADWSNNTCTKTATGVTASNTIFVSPAPDSLSTYGEAGVYCSAQAANSLTFTCTATPTTSVSVNVVIFD